jgi:hypothetical protein
MANELLLEHFKKEAERILEEERVKDKENFNEFILTRHTQAMNEARNKLETYKKELKESVDRLEVYKNTKDAYDMAIKSNLKDFNLLIDLLKTVIESVFGKYIKNPLGPIEKLIEETRRWGNEYIEHKLNNKNEPPTKEILVKKEVVKKDNNFARNDTGGNTPPKKSRR